MPADIEERAERTIVAADQQDRNAGLVVGHEVAGLRQQAAQADIDRALAEELVLLGRGLLRTNVIADVVGIDAVRHRRRLLIEIAEQCLPEAT